MIIGISDSFAGHSARREDGSFNRPPATQSATPLQALPETPEQRKADLIRFGFVRYVDGAGGQSLIVKDGALYIQGKYAPPALI